MLRARSSCVQFKFPFDSPHRGIISLLKCSGLKVVALLKQMLAMLLPPASLVFCRAMASSKCQWVQMSFSFPAHCRRTGAYLGFRDLGFRDLGFRVEGPREFAPHRRAVQVFVPPKQDLCYGGLLQTDSSRSLKS